MLEKHSQYLICPIFHAVALLKELFRPNEELPEKDSEDHLLGGCKGADCAMWQYLETDDSELHGYCGLAGKPND
jgi:hypothetical protein